MWEDDHEPTSGGTEGRTGEIRQTTTHAETSSTCRHMDSADVTNEHSDDVATSTPLPRRVRTVLSTSLVKIAYTRHWDGPVKKRNESALMIQRRYRQWRKGKLRFQQQDAEDAGPNPKKQRTAEQAAMAVAQLW